MNSALSKGLVAETERREGPELLSPVCQTMRCPEVLLSVSGLHVWPLGGGVGANWEPERSLSWHSTGTAALGFLA